MKTLYITHYRLSHCVGPLYRIGLALGIAVFFTLYGEGISIFEAVLYPSFYPAVLGSAVIAFLLISFVHYVTIRLDNTIGWVHNMFKRFCLQLFMGFALPCIMAYYLACLYFITMGTRMQERDYLVFDYPLVVIFLALLNCYYYFGYTINYLRGNVQHLGTLLAAKDGDTNGRLIGLPEVLITFNTQQIRLDATQEVAYFYSNNGSWIKTKQGSNYSYHMPLSDIEAKFCGQHFLRISRNCIINRDIIDRYLPGERNGTYIIHVKNEYQKLNGQGDKMLTVTETYSARFTTWVAATRPDLPV